MPHRKFQQQQRQQNPEESDPVAELIAQAEAAPGPAEAVVALVISGTDLGRRIYERIVSIVTSFRQESMELFSAFVAGWIAVCLAGPGDYLTGPDSSPRMAPMVNLAPEWAWALVFGVGALWQAVTLVASGMHDPPRRGWAVARIAGQCVAIGAWAFLAVLLTGTGLTIGTGIFFGISGFLLIGVLNSAFVFRTHQDYRGFKRAAEAGEALPPPAPPPSLGPDGGGPPLFPPPGPAAFLRHAGQLGIRFVAGMGEAVHRAHRVTGDGGKTTRHG